MALEGGALAGAIIGGIFGGIILLIVITILCCWACYKKDKQSATPLPVRYEKKAEMQVSGGLDIFPMVSAVFKSLPNSTRRNMILKGAAPKKIDIPDWFDHFGEDPYKITEVVPGKIWCVEYKLENFMAFDASGKAMSKMFGMDFTDEKTAALVMKTAKALGKHEENQTAADIKLVKEFNKKVEEVGKTKETLREAGPFYLNMIVVKLNNGDVLLYSPVRVRDDLDFGGWMEKIGPVKWVVLGSSAHTLQIPTTMKRYPDAKYVSSRDAWDKLVNMEGWTKKKADFEYDNPDSLQKLNNLLDGQGIKFHCVNGDIATRALIPIAHNTALECDVIYSISDGGYLNASKEDMSGGDEKWADLRLFRMATSVKPISPNEKLPLYRFWMLDPRSPMAAMNGTPPAKDGSCCLQMADSLRSILAESFDQAVGVHTGPISGEVFRESVDQSWNWLDGQSLLRPKLN